MIIWSCKWFYLFQRLFFPGEDVLLVASLYFETGILFTFILLLLMYVYNGWLILTMIYEDDGAYKRQLCLREL